MDWSKAKTILILIFAVLNVILYLGNLNIAETSNSIPSSSEIKNERYLKRKQYCC